MSREPGRFALFSALGAVYLFWGSTYLMILFAIETIPPLLMAGSRFLVAGALLFAFDRMRGGRWPTRKEWLGAAITGTLLLGMGNGGATWAEQTVPSGVAALIVSSVPLWMTILDWGRPGGTRPSGTTLGGVLLGTIGLIILIGPMGGEGVPARGVGVVVLLVATLAWAGGSVLARHVALPSSATTTTSTQMVAGGGMLLLAGLLSGEGAALDLESITGRSVAAWGYLVVFGSWVGFSAYVWLLRATTTAIASTHAFVNPVVAVLLGAWFASEPVNARMMFAMGVIVAAVALIVLTRSRRPRRELRTEAGPAEVGLTHACSASELTPLAGKSLLGSHSRNGGAGAIARRPATRQASSKRVDGTPC